MTAQERIWFEELSLNLAEDAKTLEKTRYAGFWNSVIDKYSSRGHFVYELLQNADDVGATECEFCLKHDCLFFSHNGTKHFTISDPETEEADQKSGCLGCLNSITSIGQSEKDTIDAKAGNRIGKFGIGFKSVFRYTDNPCIYDENVCFRLEKRIVPVKIEDTTGRVKNWTLFKFAFDRRDVSPNTAFTEVAQALSSFRFPLLFLKNLRLIRCTVRNREGEDVAFEYLKSLGPETRHTHFADNVISRVVHLAKRQDSCADAEDDFRVFSQVAEDGLEYSVAYKIDGVGRPVPFEDAKAFCYFETAIPTGLRHIIQAPFRLTDNREGIKNEPYNEDLFARLSRLSAYALLGFKEIGESVGNCLIDDSVVDLLPQEGSAFKRFTCFRDEYLRLFQVEEILPTTNGFARFKDACWAETHDEIVLFPDSILRNMFGAESSWVFCSCPADTGSIRRQGIASFLAKKLIPLGKVILMMSPEFVEAQVGTCGMSWLNGLYKCLLGNERLKLSLSEAPVLINKEGRAVCAKKHNGALNVYLPSEVDSAFDTVDPQILELEYGKRFCEWMGLRKPYKMDSIIRLIRDVLPKITEDAEYMRVFKQVFDFWTQANRDGQEKVELALKENKVIRVRNFSKAGAGMPLVRNAAWGWLPTKDLQVYFDGLDADFVDLEFYDTIAGAERVKMMQSLLVNVGCKCLLDCSHIWWQKVGAIETVHFAIPGCEANLKRIEGMGSDKQMRLSCVVWRLIGAALYQKRDKVRVLSEWYFGKCKWLVDKQGKPVKPGEMFVDDMPTEYNSESAESQWLIRLLGMKRNPEIVARESLSDQDKSALEIGRRVMENGVEPEKIELLVRQIKECALMPIDREQSLGGGLADVSLSDGQYAGLSQMQKAEVLHEAKIRVLKFLGEAGYQVAHAVHEKEYTIINGVMKDGVEHPLVVHSYKNRNRPFMLTAADWAQLMKPKSILCVVTTGGVCTIPFKDLVCNREQICLKFSTSNLEMKDRLPELADVMRWFKGLRFDFGSLIPLSSTIKHFDLPERKCDEELMASDEGDVF